MSDASESLTTWIAARRAELDRLFEARLRAARRRRSRPAASRRCATRCWRPASASARCWRWRRPRRSAPARDDVRARLRRRRAGALLLADSRRPAGDGRRRLPAGPPEQPQGLRRGDRDPGGRRAADAGVRLDRRSRRARRAAAAISSPLHARWRARRARAAWCAGRPATWASPHPPRWRRWRRCTPKRPRRCSARRWRSAGCAGGAAPDARATLARFGTAYGIAFQHADDAPTTSTREHAGAARDRLRSAGRRRVRGGRAARRARRSSRRACARALSHSPSVSVRHIPTNGSWYHGCGMAADEQTQMFATPVAPAGSEAGPRLSGRPGRRERRRDVQGRGRQDDHRPRPEGADPAVRRRHLARARPDRGRGRATSSCRTSARPTAPSATASRWIAASWSTATRSWSARPPSSSSRTTTTWTRSSSSRCTSRRCATG